MYVNVWCRTSIFSESRACVTAFMCALNPLVNKILCSLSFPVNDIDINHATEELCDSGKSRNLTSLDILVNRMRGVGGK